jgi:hypothetical protein
MLQQNTRESAVRREEFHRILKDWLDESFDDRVGDDTSHAGPAWLWVRHGGRHFHLNAGTTRAGVRNYLKAVEQNGGDPRWSTRHSADTRVTIGPGSRVIEGFEFHQDASRR